MSEDQKLSTLAKILPGFLAKSRIELSRSGSHNLIQVRDFSTDRRYLTLPEESLFTPDANRLTLVKKNDILFLSKGSYFAHHLVAAPPSTLASSLFFIIRPISDLVNPAFLAWQLNQAEARRHFYRSGASLAQLPVVSRKTLETTPIQLPPREVQEKIVTLDQLTHQHSTLLQKLDEKRRLLTTTACRQALTTY